MKTLFRLSIGTRYVHLGIGRLWSPKNNNGSTKAGFLLLRLTTSLSESRASELGLSSFPSLVQSAICKKWEGETQFEREKNGEDAEEPLESRWSFASADSSCRRRSTPAILVTSRLRRSEREWATNTTRRLRRSVRGRRRPDVAVGERRPKVQRPQPRPRFPAQPQPQPILN